MQNQREGNFSQCIDCGTKPLYVFTGLNGQMFIMFVVKMGKLCTKYSSTAFIMHPKACNIITRNFTVVKNVYQLSGSTYNINEKLSQDMGTPHPK